MDRADTYDKPIRLCICEEEEDKAGGGGGGREERSERHPIQLYRGREGTEEGRREKGMEKYFGNAYRGDPGVPHADPERFVNIWIGSFAFSALTWSSPYLWQLSNQFNWHDRAMLFEQYHWKKAMKKGEPYEFKWNKHMTKEERESYYFNWPVYFP